MSFLVRLMRLSAGRNLPLVALAAMVVLLLGAVAAWSNHLSTEVEGHTTLDVTICGKDPSSAGCLGAGAR